MVIPLQFAHAEPFSDGLALVYTTWGMNLLGKVEGVWLLARAGYIDHDCKFVIKPRLVENAKDFSQGLAAFEPGASSWGYAKWGYLDKTGKWAIKPQFDMAGNFSEGLAPVAVFLDKKSNREKWGYIDQSGKLKTPAQFDTAHPSARASREYSSQRKMQSSNICIIRKGSGGDVSTGPEKSSSVPSNRQRGKSLRNDPGFLQLTHLGQKLAIALRLR